LNREKWDALKTRERTKLTEDQKKEVRNLEKD
jgi:hypothetical protein